MRKILFWVATNKYLHLFLGVMIILGGVNEVWETIEEDLLAANLRGSHGAAMLGAIHCLRSLSEFVEAADAFKEGAE